MMRKFILTVLILLSVHTYANSNTVNDYRELTTVCDTNVNMDKLINVLIHVESKGNANAISKNGTCVGALQIKKVVVDDCNLYLKKQKYKYEDRFNEEKSIEMFKIIQTKYKNFKRHRSDSDLEHMIRLWNGGCNYNIDSTQSYYEKVMNIYYQN